MPPHTNSITYQSTLTHLSLRNTVHKQAITAYNFVPHTNTVNCANRTGQAVFPYSLLSVEPGADPGVQAVSPQVTFKSSLAVGCHYFPPGLRSPSHPKNVIVLWPVPSYTAWWQRHIGVNNLPKVVTQLCPGGNWTHDLLITSPTFYRYATAPPSQVQRDISGMVDRVITCSTWNDRLWNDSLLHNIGTSSLEHIASDGDPEMTSENSVPTVCSNK